MFGHNVFNCILIVFNYNFNFKNCKHNNNLITCENSNRYTETYNAYVTEVSLKMANKSG